MSDLACTAYATEVFGDASTRADAQRLCAEASADPCAIACRIWAESRYDRRQDYDYVSWCYQVQFDGRAL